MTSIYRDVVTFCAPLVVTVVACGESADTGEDNQSGRGTYQLIEGRGADLITALGNSDAVAVFSEVSADRKPRESAVSAITQFDGRVIARIDG